VSHDADPTEGVGGGGGIGWPGWAPTHARADLSITISRSCPTQ